MSTAIPYLDEVWNVTTGCGDDMVSPGCLNCYARRMTKRNLWKCPECGGAGQIDVPGILYDQRDTMECPRCDGTGKATFAPTFHADRLDQPLHWRKPRVVGVSFMGDLFHEVITDEQRDRVFLRFAMCPGWALEPGPDDEPRTGRHTFLVLTKRPEAMHRYLTDPDRWWKLEEAMEREGWSGETMDLVYDNTKGHAAFPNVWLGVTVCNQAEADRNIPILLATPAAKRWVSIEPMLGAVRVIDYFRGAHRWPQDGRIGSKHHTDGLDWLVLGGETGPGARRMNASWAVDVWKQCRAAGVPFYWKQAGSAWLPGDGTDDDDDSAVLDCHELPAVTP